MFLTFKTIEKFRKNFWKIFEKFWKISKKFWKISKNFRILKSKNFYFCKTFRNFKFERFWFISNNGQSFLYVIDHL